MSGELPRTETDNPATQVNSNPFWSVLLACPSCGAKLGDVSRCSSCKAVFSADGGTPCLISGESRRTFPYTFAQSRSVAPKEFVRSVLVDPPIDTDSATMPYHMDAAHARFLKTLPAGSRVLEIGCGGGQCRPWFNARGIEYVGVDISKTRIHDWLQRFGGPDLLCDTHFLPFLDGSFDAVYSAAVTEHLACPPLAAREVFRVLKPGGFYLGNVSFLEPWHDNSYFHMTPLGVVELLQGAGFEPRYVWPGRGYSGFKAICAMGFRPPLRVLKYFGQMVYVLYRAQSRVLAMARKARHRPELPDIFDRAKVAGAIDWIAQRPGA
jgi:ubiquinone/menaquinone biosynthesis C-methylase UbiE